MPVVSFEAVRMGVSMAFFLGKRMSITFWIAFGLEQWLPKFFCGTPF